MGEVLWYHEDAGKQAGPITEAAMAEALRLGRLAPGSRVWRAGMAAWQAWETVPELAALAAPPPLDGPPAFPTAPAAGAPPHGAGARPFGGDSYAGDVLTGAGAPALYPKAPLGSRFLAALLDNLISTVPAVLLGIAAAGAFAAHSSALGPLAVLAFLLACGWALFYNFTKDGRPGGASVGKKAMGLMVVHLATNRPCSRGQSALRYLVLLGLNLIPYLGWLVEPVVTLVSAGGRRLGDSAAGTQVILAASHRVR